MNDFHLKLNYANGAVTVIVMLWAEYKFCISGAGSVKLSWIKGS